jgi:hypothetical protein
MYRSHEYVIKTKTGSGPLYICGGPAAHRGLGKPLFPSRFYERATYNFWFIYVK